MAKPKRFKSKASYRKFTDYVKINGLSKRKKGHTVIIGGKKHKVKHKKKR